MARPLKDGVDYFPLDCIMDDKVKLIEAEFGLKGFAIVVKLWQRIYSLGYYCEWNKEVALLFSREVGEGCNVVSEIVQAAIKRGIFDKSIYSNYGILTSRGIQKRYFNSVSRRTLVTVKREYLLVEIGDNMVYENGNPVNVRKNSKNVCDNPQSKVKESIVEESKLKNYCDGDGERPCAPAREDAGTETVQTFLADAEQLDRLPQEVKARLYGTIDTLYSEFWDTRPNDSDYVQLYRLLCWLHYSRKVGWQPLEMTDDDVELLAHSFESAAMADAKNLAYVKGVFARYKERGIQSDSDFWEYEYRRNRAHKG